MMRLTESYFHLSYDQTLTKLTPKLPAVATEGYKLTHPTETPLENITIKRVCLASAIAGCIAGIFVNDKRLLREDITLHVYQNTSSFLGLSNEEIIKRRYVFDAAITGEVWALEEISVVHLYRIKINKERSKHIVYKPITPSHLKEIPSVYFLHDDGNFDHYVHDYKVI